MRYRKRILLNVIDWIEMKQSYGTCLNLISYHWSKNHCHRTEINFAKGAINNCLKRKALEHIAEPSNFIQLDLKGNKFSTIIEEEDLRSIIPIAFIFITKQCPSSSSYKYYFLLLLKEWTFSLNYCVFVLYKFILCVFGGCNVYALYWKCKLLTIPLCCTS